VVPTADVAQTDRHGEEEVTFMEEDIALRERRKRRKHRRLNISQSSIGMN
jgi:hypothetical protein